MSFKDDPTFLKVIPLILNSEAGYVNHPKDPGGPTMRGVAWNYNREWLMENGYTFGTINRLTKDDAERCYYEKYWLKSKGNGITDVDLAYIHLDAAINCGTGQAEKFLSRLSKDPRHFDFTGGKNRTLALTLFLEYTAQRLSFYTHCKGRDVFLEGWINRMADVINNSLGLD